MLILPPDQIVLDHVAAREPAIIGRAVDWANVNSGSRNADGLARVLALLEAEARNLPAEVVRIPTQASTTVTDDGAVRNEAHADALKITARPDAPIQVVLTGHYDPAFPAASPLQPVPPRPHGPLNGPAHPPTQGPRSLPLAQSHPPRAPSTGKGFWKRDPSSSPLTTQISTTPGVGPLNGWIAASIWRR